MRSLKIEAELWEMRRSQIKQREGKSEGLEQTKKVEKVVQSGKRWKQIPGPTDKVSVQRKRHTGRESKAETEA